MTPVLTVLIVLGILVGILLVFFVLLVVAAIIGEKADARHLAEARSYIDDPDAPEVLRQAGEQYIRRQKSIAQAAAEAERFRQAKREFRRKRTP